MIDLLRPRDVPAATNDAITERQVRRWIAERRLPVVKPAGKTGPAYIRRKDLERFLRANTVPARR